jgi:hypothetical protein
MENYTLQWHRYRRLNRLGFIAFAFFFAVPFTFAGLEPYLPQQIAKGVFVASGCAAMLWLFGTLALIGFWHCPRCGNWYSRRTLLWQSLGRKCVHCGLKLYEGDMSRVRAPGG